MPRTTNGSAALQVLVLTQGLQNYGAYLERVTRGLQGAVTWNGQDMTHNGWTQVAGLQGEAQSYFTAAGAQQVPWVPLSGPLSTPMAWVQVNITTPSPLPAGSVWALDLASMGKGAVYLNGNHLGRYWNIKATQMTCDTCDYAGTFDPIKCRTGCGDYSQRYYHAPVEWLAPPGAANLVVLFEETGSGDPTQISLVQMN